MKWYVAIFLSCGYGLDRRYRFIMCLFTHYCALLYCLTPNCYSGSRVMEYDIAHAKLGEHANFDEE